MEAPGRETNQGVQTISDTGHIQPGSCQLPASCKLVGGMRAILWPAVCAPRPRGLIMEDEWWRGHHGVDKSSWMWNHGKDKKWRRNDGGGIMEGISNHGGGMMEVESWTGYEIVEEESWSGWEVIEEK